MAPDKRRFKLSRYVRRRAPSVSAAAGADGGPGGMEALKFEVARDLGLGDAIRDRGFANMTTREVGKIGGQMVRRLVRHAEKDLEAGEEP